MTEGRVKRDVYKTAVNQFVWFGDSGNGKRSGGKAEGGRDEDKIFIRTDQNRQN